jgi:hypothetical protein
MLYHPFIRGKTWTARNFVRIPEQCFQHLDLEGRFQILFLLAHAFVPCSEIIAAKHMLRTALKHMRNCKRMLNKHRTTLINL